MATAAPAPATPAPGDPVAPGRTTLLRKGALGLIDAFVIAVSSTAPAYSVATSLYLLSAAVLLQAPAAIIIGFFPVMGIAVAFWVLNRQDPDCGASYMWVGRALGRPMGFMNGWVIIVTDIVFMTFAAPQCGQATLQLVNNAAVYSPLGINLNAGDQKAQLVVGLLWLIVVTWMVVVGIKLAARFQWLLLGLEYLIVVGFAIGGLFHGGAYQPAWDWLSPRAFGDLGTLTAGVVIAVFFYWGWDTAANVNEESRDSLENPGRAGMLGMLALLGIFLLSAISIQHVMTPDAIAASGTSTLYDFASALVGQPWSSLAVLAVISSTVATLQTTLLPSARTAFSMSRDGTLGRVWGTVHPRWRTPWLGTIIMGAITAVLAILSLNIGKLSAVVGAGVSSIGVMVAFYYGFTGIASAVRWMRTGRRRVVDAVLAAVVPVLSWAALWALAGYYIVSSWRSSDSLTFDATNGRFLALVPIVLIAAGIPGMILAMAAGPRRRRVPAGTPAGTAPATTGGA